MVTNQAYFCFRNCALAFSLGIQGWKSNFLFWDTKLSVTSMEHPCLPICQIYGKESFVCFLFLHHTGKFNFSYIILFLCFLLRMSPSKNRDPLNVLQNYFFNIKSHACTKKAPNKIFFKEPMSEGHCLYIYNKVTIL